MYVTTTSARVRMLTVTDKAFNMRLSTYKLNNNTNYIRDTLGAIWHTFYETMRTYQK